MSSRKFLKPPKLSKNQTYYNEKYIPFCELILFITLLNPSCKKDFCEDAACKNNGICMDGACHCPDGFEGKFCEINIVQQRLDNGETPFEIYQSDTSWLSFLYGKIYQGGLIFYMNTADGTGLVAAPSDYRHQQFGDKAPWGCVGMEIDGADGSGIGAGPQNTMDIVSNCTDPFVAASFCGLSVEGGYEDWFLPSIDELSLMQFNLFRIDNNHYGLKAYNFLTGTNEGAAYWSSTESNENKAWRYVFSFFSLDLKSEIEKGSKNYVRPVRAF